MSTINDSPESWLLGLVASRGVACQLVAGSGHDLVGDCPAGPAGRSRHPHSWTRFRTSIMAFIAQPSLIPLAFAAE